jgi:anti-sigma B factor antagonist
MNINVISNGDDVVCLALEGRFDAHEVTGFRTQLDAIVPPAASIDVDLADVNFIDSSALAELVRGLKHCRQLGGDLRLLSPSNPVRVILELTGLDKAFEISTTS